MSCLREHSMAFWKSRGNEFVILLAFSTLSTLIHCRSFQQLQTTSDEWDKTSSDLSDQEAFDDQLAVYDYPIDDVAVSDLPRSAVETNSDEGDKTSSDMSDQEGFDDQLSDFDYLSEDVGFSDLPSAVETNGEKGDKTSSDMSDQEGFGDQLADFDYPIDDVAVFDLPRSALETNSDDGDKTFYMSDQAFDDQLADFDYPIDDAAVSDLPRSTVMQGQFEGSSDGIWDAMSPKLRCGDDFMNLQLFGSGVDQVELCRGNSAPVPLGHLPPNCGHTSPTHGGLVYATPYDGCGVAQKEGNYVMQMLWQGIPVVLSCPMT